MSGLLDVLPQLSEWLRRPDEIVRIVGSKELLAGIRSGTLHYMQSDLGHTTAVLDRSSQIVGHVQLQPEAVVGTLAPAAAVFQVAAVVTSQYYLQRFDAQLDSLQKSLRDVRRHAAWAQVLRATLKATASSPKRCRSATVRFPPTFALGSTPKNEPSTCSQFKKRSRCRMP